MPFNESFLRQWTFQCLLKFRVVFDSRHTLQRMRFPSGFTICPGLRLAIDPTCLIFNWLKNQKFALIYPISKKNNKYYFSNVKRYIIEKIIKKIFFINWNFQSVCFFQSWSNIKFYFFLFYFILFFFIRFFQRLNCSIKYSYS